MDEVLHLAGGAHSLGGHYDVGRQALGDLAREGRSGEEGEPLGLETRHRLLEDHRHQLEGPLLDALRGDHDDRVAPYARGRQCRHRAQMARWGDEDDQVRARRHLRGVRRCPDGLRERDVREVGRIRMPGGDLLGDLGLVRPHRHRVLEPRQVAGERGAPRSGADDSNSPHAPIYSGAPEAAIHPACGRRPWSRGEASRARRPPIGAGSAGALRTGRGQRPDPTGLQREITIFEVLARWMLFGTNGKGAIGLKVLRTVTTTVLPGSLVPGFSHVTSMSPVLTCTPTVLLWTTALMSSTDAG